MKRNLDKFERKEQERISRRVYQIEREREHDLNWDENRKAMMDVQFCQMLKKYEKDYLLEQEEEESSLNENRRVMRDVQFRQMLERFEKDYILEQEEEEESNLNENRRVIRDVALRRMIYNDYKKIDNNATKNY